MNAQNSVFLSIVVPAYNEEKRLPQTLERILAYTKTNSWVTEIVVVDDGSGDRTVDLVRAVMQQRPEVRLLSNAGNRGKGFSVRRGVMESRGRYVLFSDADLSAPIEEADKMVATLDEGWDVVVGSRDIDPSLLELPQGKMRRLAGRVFRNLVYVVLGLPFLDTQCGFKAFRREAALAVFNKQRIEGFGFDVEILFLARRQNLRVVEIGVRWRNDPATRVHLMRDSLRMAFDVFRVRWLALTGAYALGQRSEPKPGL